MNSTDDYDSPSDYSSYDSAAPMTPTTSAAMAKDLPLMHRMNQSVSRRARRVKRAIERKAKGPQTVSFEDVNGLHGAAERGDIAAVKEYLEAKGIDPNTPSCDGTTALHTAVRMRNMALIELLINAKGININALDNDKKPALFYAKPAKTGDDSAADESTATNEATSPTARSEDLTEEERLAEEIINLLTSHGAMTDEDYFRDSAASGEELKNNLESSDVVDSMLIRKVVVTMALPFIFLVFVNGLVFALKFLGVSIAFYFVAIGYFLSEVMLKPPWWSHNPNGKSLRLKGCPDYWDGKLHNPKRDLKLDYSDITVTTHDGILLRGWFVPSCAPKERQSKMCIVLVHGGGRDRRAWLRHVPFFSAAGYSCVLFDMRDHGLSGGPSRGLTFGMRERYDLVAVCAYARDRLGFANVAVVGTSIGASTCIMAAAMDPKIDVVVAENPLLTAAHLQDTHIQKMFGPYFTHARYSEVIFTIFRFICSNWLNFKLGNKPTKRCQSVHVISQIAPRPVLLMHGTLDDVVPFYHSETLFSHAKEPKELWLVPEAVHCCLHNKAPEEFEYRVLRFLAKHDPSISSEADRALFMPTPPKGVAPLGNSVVPSPHLSPAGVGVAQSAPEGTTTVIADGRIVAGDVPPSALTSDEEPIDPILLAPSLADPKLKKVSLKAEKLVEADDEGTAGDASASA